jgi:TolA-binding protein
MSAGDEIITPVTKPEAVSMAEIHAMGGLTDAVSALGRQIERMNAKVDDVRERVIKLEAREYERQIEALNDRLSAAFKRIDDLEGTRDQQKGAKALVDWLRQTAPWLLAGIAAFVAGISIKNGAGA